MQALTIHSNRILKWIHRLGLLAILCGIFLPAAAQSVPARYSPVSKGIYRFPYADGTTVNVTRSHDTHYKSRNRLDMNGDGMPNDSGYTIVAAASGWIRVIEDGNTLEQCNGTPGCGNNYVWVEHPNGEWTKYSHLATNTVRIENGWTEGDWICQGEILGTEDDIGFASGPHLHFEVAVPNNPANPCNSGGWLWSDNSETIINGDTFLTNLQNRVPLFCLDGISRPVLSGETVVVNGQCSKSECFTNNTVQRHVFTSNEVMSYRADNYLTHLDTFEVHPQAGAVFHAGSKIRLKPGLKVVAGGYFRAHIAPCNDPGAMYEPTCNVVGGGISLKGGDESPTLVELLNPLEVRAFPNPTAGRVTFQGSFPEDAQAVFEIYNLQGQVVKTLYRDLSVSAGAFEVEADLTGLPSGTYIYRLSDGTEVVVDRLIVQ